MQRNWGGEEEVPGVPVGAGDGDPEGGGREVAHDQHQPPVRQPHHPVLVSDLAGGGDAAADFPVGVGRRRL
eukprot:COSAG04_NODE_6517_length_1310_cov_3.337737_4_plen_70_part_01